MKMVALITFLGVECQVFRTFNTGAPYTLHPDLLKTDCMVMCSIKGHEDRYIDYWWAYFQVAFTCFFKP